MATEPTIWREPDVFTAGDTLIYQRSLPRFLPSDGWAIRLTITQNKGDAAVEVAQAVSVGDSTNKYHVFNVPNFCGNLTSGVYTFSEEVFNAAGNAGINVAAGERHALYSRPDFQIRDNLDSGANARDQRTTAQKNIELLEHRLAEIYKLKFSEHESDRNRFNLVDEEKVLKQLQYWKEVRIGEIRMERVKNGQEPGNVVRPRFMIGC